MQRCWLDLGADSYRIKPVSMQTLESLITYAFEKRSLIQKRRRDDPKVPHETGYDESEEGRLTKRPVFRHDDQTNLKTPEPMPAIIDLIAQGRRGPVHFALHQDRPVALKIISREAVRGLPPPEHPHVNEVLRRFVSAGQCVEMRALCDGGEFFDLLAEYPDGLPVAEVRAALAGSAATFERRQPRLPGRPVAPPSPLAPRLSRRLRRPRLALLAAPPPPSGWVNAPSPPVIIVVFHWLIGFSPSPCPQVFYWFHQLVSAVAHCHRHGAVNGQMAPENLLLCGESATMSLTGFSCCGVAPHTPCDAMTSLAPSGPLSSASSALPSAPLLPPAAPTAREWVEGALGVAVDAPRSSQAGPSAPENAVCGGGADGSNSGVGGGKGKASAGEGDGVVVGRFNGGDWSRWSDAGSCGGLSSMGAGGSEDAPSTSGTGSSAADGACFAVQAHAALPAPASLPLLPRLSDTASVTLRPIDARFDAPELLGRTQASPRELAACDIHALGVLLLYMMTGQPGTDGLAALAEADDLNALPSGIRSIGLSEVASPVESYSSPPPSSTRCSLRRILVSLVSATLTADPAQRPSAEELLRRLVTSRPLLLSCG